MTGTKELISDFGVDKVIDGEIGTMYISASTDEPKYVMVDLGRLYSITEIQLKHSLSEY